MQEVIVRCYLMLVLESKHGLQLVLDYVVQTDTTPLVDDYRERAKVKSLVL